MYQIFNIHILKPYRLPLFNEETEVSMSTDLDLEHLALVQIDHIIDQQL